MALLPERMSPTIDKEIPESIGIIGRYIDYMRNHLEQYSSAMNIKHVSYDAKIDALRSDVDALRKEVDALKKIVNNL